MTTLRQLMSLALLAASLQGQCEEQRQAPPNCVDVEVNGYKSLSYECLGQQMNNPRGGQAYQKNVENLSVPPHLRAPNQIGLFNQAATSHRMGSNFGKSAFPQRPSAPTGSSPLLKGR